MGESVPFVVVLADFSEGYTRPLLMSSRELHRFLLLWLVSYSLTFLEQAGSQAATLAAKVFVVVAVLWEAEEGHILL